MSTDKQVALSKEEILYQNIESRGGFKGVSFEQFLEMINGGDLDMVKGLESSFAAMDDYARIKSIELIDFMFSKAAQTVNPTTTKPASWLIDIDTVVTAEQLYNLFLQDTQTT